MKVLSEYLNYSSGETLVGLIVSSVSEFFHNHTNNQLTNERRNEKVFQRTLSTFEEKDRYFELAGNDIADTMLRIS